jgi:ABC-type Na+ efflux pump permease subunit
MLGDRIHPRAIWRIARWEVSRGSSVLDRRALVAGLVALLVIATVGVTAAGGGLALDRGLYRIGIDEGHALYTPVQEDPRLVATEPTQGAIQAGTVDVLVQNDTLRLPEGSDGEITRKAAAAMSALRTAANRHNDRAMVREANQSAAFPVTVQLLYVTRTDPGRAGGGGATTGGGGGGATGGDTGGGGTGGGTSTDSTASGGGSQVGGGGGGGRIAAPSVGAGPLFTGNSSGTPSSISPPFPFESLLLAFLFIVPMNFVIQAYGGTILNERVNRRGELLLSAPVAPVDIVLGKTIPYLGVMAGIAILTALAVGGGPLSIAAVAPIAVLFLAATFVGAMFARSFKELTFVTVAVSTGLTTYAFVPAIFASIGSVGLISPLTLVVRDLQGTPISPLEFAFSTVPLALVATVLFALGVSVYREEDMFTQRPLHRKALDALARHVAGAKSVALVTVLSVPFVFVAELLAVAVLFSLPIELSIPPLILSIVVIEELAKSLHVHAGYTHGRFGAGWPTGLALGAASGAGFFIAEKGMLVVQLVGLSSIEQGRIAFGTPTGVAGVPTPVLLVLPLALHVVTASCSALGARRGEGGYGMGLVLAIGIHAAYNLAILGVAGGGF